MMAKPIGFDQKVLLHHLDFTANEARRLERKEMYEVLDNFLRADIKGAKSRKNAITMLMKIWYLVEDSHIVIRDRALEMLPFLKPEEKVLLHWCMTMLAYPFFRDLIKEMGRQLRMQDTVPSQVLGKKMKSLYGERRRVEVATSAVLMSIKSWGITELQKNRAYSLLKKVEIHSQELLQLIAEVLLTINDSHILPIELMNNNVLFFPFHYNISASVLMKNKFELIKSIDMTMVELKS
ncbi:hypothetical protein RCG24_07595 [Neobacillus sp. OS1-32]|uniref:hypothetical protein n=1 Tax=Neobacillus sp. OS1-32 TaxID=3070682 RepID=UPI0027E20713|nr:hypothetical protein [Neobacillus sp. OS1-32]WML31710.1 hypothetical protein RCG24_07595 [Neobacillus sp. OS1-32]